MNNYNTTRPDLILKEYGRNMQMLISFIKTIEDKEKRTESAYVLVELMKLINPVARDSQESGQKLWDDLYIKDGRRIMITEVVPQVGVASTVAPPKSTGYKAGKTPPGSGPILGIDDIEHFRTDREKVLLASIDVERLV